MFGGRSCPNKELKIKKRYNSITRVVFLQNIEEFLFILSFLLKLLFYYFTYYIILSITSCRSSIQQLKYIIWSFYY